MFTIKHVTPLGNEALLPAVHVTYSPTQAIGNQREGYEPLTGTVFYRDPTANPELPYLELQDGVVYVMNDTGATVGKYDLGGWAIDQPKSHR